MKSYASFLEGLYLNILRDVESKYPLDALEWRRDHSRLLSCMENRGLRFFTVDLPSMGKHFDMCLSMGSLSLSGLPCQKAFKKGVAIPRLFRGLLRRVFHDNGDIRPDIDTNAVRFLRELYYASKKLRQECEPAYVYQTVAEFYDVERQCRRPTLQWDADSFPVDSVGIHLSFNSESVEKDRVTSEGVQGNLPFIEEAQPSTLDASCLSLLQRVCDWVVGGQFGPLMWRDLRPKHGPGAVADARVGVDFKYRFPHWPNKLEQIFPIQEYGYANYNAWEADLGFAFSDDTLPSSHENGTKEVARGYQRQLFDVGPSVALSYTRGGDSDREAHKQDRPKSRETPGLLHEPPSRLIAVPKTQKGPRLIASEPVAHQWIQQALKCELERMVERSVLKHSISFRDQELSRRAALDASRTGLKATIDLSSASDRLTCWVVERVFRSHGDWLRALHACRTRWLVNNIDKKRPKYVVLKKFAPMGAAVTFPVQSVVYALVAITAVLYCRKWSLDNASLVAAARQVRVFGDDIIVPVDVAGVLTELLTELGLKVSPTKTFTRGFFRESCGMDAYAGVDVTPAYVLEVCDKARPESVASVVDSSNNFWKKGLVNTANYLQTTIPSELRKKIPVVEADSGAFGFHFWLSEEERRFKKRYNAALQRLEVQVLSVRSRFDKLYRGGWASLLQFYTENPDPDILWTSGVNSRPKVSLCLRWVPAQAGGASPT